MLPETSLFDAVVPVKSIELISDSWIESHGKHGVRKRVVIARCPCGKEFKTLLASIKDGATKTCGCRGKVKKPNRIFVSIQGEEWRPASKFEGYEVSNLGRLRSWNRFKDRANKVPHLIIACEDSDGKYLRVSLRKDGRKVNCSVHALVATAFIGSCPGGLECAHQNGNKKDNRADNLRWMTRSENCQQKWEHGTFACGKKIPTTKLNATLVIEALEMYVGGASKNAVALRFGLDPCTVRDLMSGKNWWYVPRPAHLSVEITKAILLKRSGKHAETISGAPAAL